tara:strand:+ start:144346 stop:146370 length:2025 start_codon:yes stop_codon:yes gene_type:complete
MHDPYLYLEEIDSKESVTWAQEQTAKAVSHLSSTKHYSNLMDEALDIHGNTDKVEFAHIQKDDNAYKLITSKEHPLGVLCRMPKESYLKNSSNWEELLDLNKLAKSESVNWSYEGFILSPDKTRLMIMLSPDGGDDIVAREFDIASKSFTKDGLDIARGKTRFSYVDDDTLLVASTCDGDVTNSTYAQNLRLLKRGEIFNNTPIIFSCAKNSISVQAFICKDDDFKHCFVYESLTFWTSNLYYLHADNTKTKLNLPLSLSVSSVDKKFIYLHLQEDWTVGKETYSTGDIVSVHLTKLLKGHLQVKNIYQATCGAIINSFNVIDKNTAVVNQMKDVCSQLLILKKRFWSWEVVDEVPLPETGSANFDNYLEDTKQIIVSYTDNITPYTEYAYCLKSKALSPIKSQKSLFNHNEMQVTQKFATSKDGTQVPYFIMHKKGLVLDGNNPTIMYGYGGFNINMTPNFSNIIGKLWLERGGVYVLTNIRGGAEYGPAWHASALKQNRHKCYEDFEAIAEKLIAEKVTSSKCLGIKGGSNGGLLVGACVTRRPDLFGAVFCSVPLLDMIRLEHIGAGESWVGEYGRPSDSPEMEAYLRSYSPYHNVKADVKYPRIYFSASQADNRTHPCHARKMVALMNAQGHNVLYNETVEGGHTGGTDIQQCAEETALVYSYFLSELTH